MVRAHMAVTTHAGIEPNHYQGKRIETRDEGVKHKEQKVLMVANSNAIVDPGTMICCMIDLGRCKGKVTRLGGFFDKN